MQKPGTQSPGSPSQLSTEVGIDDDQLAGVVGGAGTPNPSASSKKTDLNLNALDLETAMMTVQANRAQILEHEERTHQPPSQEEMERLQKLSHTRDEAMHTMEESRSSIIGNMR